MGRGTRTRVKLTWDVGQARLHSLFAISCNLLFTVYCSLFTLSLITTRPFHYIGMTNHHHVPYRFLLAGFALLCLVCARPTDTSGQPGLWTWVHGDSAYNVPARYGIRGVADSSNLPAGVYAPVFWTGKDGTFWMLRREGRHFALPFRAVAVRSRYADVDLDEGDSGLVDQPPTFGSRASPLPPTRPARVGLGCPALDRHQRQPLDVRRVLPKQRTGSFPFRYMSDVWKYDIPTNEWTWMARRLPARRARYWERVACPRPSTCPVRSANAPTPGPIPTTISGSTEAAWTSTRTMSSGASTRRPVNGPGCPGGTNFGNPLYGTRGVFDSQNLRDSASPTPPGRATTAGSGSSEAPAKDWCTPTSSTTSGATIRRPTSGPGTRVTTPFRMWTIPVRAVNQPIP